MYALSLAVYQSKKMFIVLCYTPNMIGCSFITEEAELNNCSLRYYCVVGQEKKAKSTVLNTLR